MSSSYSLPFGRLFSRPRGLSLRKLKEMKGEQSRNSVIADDDFCQSPDMMEQAGTSVSVSLYEQLVADCLRGETFPVEDVTLTDEENEEARELKARTFINTIVAASTTDRGDADIARADKSRPHKKVAFAENLISGPGKGYHNKCDQGKTPEFYTDSDSDSDKSIGSVVDSVVLEPPTANVIEKIMLCNCPAHTHCLTCHMSHEAFSLVLRASYEDLSPSSSARWLVTLYSLDRAVRIWVGEHVINNIHIGRDQWQTPVSEIDEATVDALREMINVAQGIAQIRKLARNVINNVRKMLKTAGKITDVIQRLEYTAAGDANARGKLAKKFVAYKNDVTTRLNTAIGVIQTMNDEVRMLLHRRIKTTKGDMLRNFEQSNVHWPRSSARKIDFIAQALVPVYNDSRTLAVRLREMYTLWNRPLQRGQVVQFHDMVKRSVVVWVDWMTEVRKSFGVVTARAEVLDRSGESKCQEGDCRRVLRVQGGLLLAG
ncbi:hypothetical protein V8F20_011618 [Naviculisporaceae sp. PSN 640]